MAYSNKERIEQEDKELEELEAAYKAEFSGEPQVEERTPLDPPSELPSVDKEEETWKKRHGDLRSYTSRQINELTKRLEETEKALKAKERESAKLPTNKAELEEWMKEYPDLTRVLGALIETQTEHIKEDVQTTRQELEAERLSIAREKALNAIVKVHPDFMTLINEEDFKDWVESQPVKRGPRIGQALYDALYNNETDADSAIEAVNVYKQDKNASKSKKDAPREATASVRRTTSSTPQSQDGKRTFSESEIEKMKPWDYDKYEEEIEAARRDGRIVYDISGAAR